MVGECKQCAQGDCALHKHPFGEEPSVCSNGLLCAVIAVEHDHITLRMPEGWLLWCSKTTTETSLGDIIRMAASNLNYKQGT